MGQTFIDRSQWQVSHPKLDRREDQIRHEVDGERRRESAAGTGSDRPFHNCTRWQTALRCDPREA